MLASRPRESISDEDYSRAPRIVSDSDPARCVGGSGLVGLVRPVGSVVASGLVGGRSCRGRRRIAGGGRCVGRRRVGRGRCRGGRGGGGGRRSTHVLRAFLGLFFDLRHPATAFKDRAVLDDQRGRLDVARDFGDTPHLDALGGDDVAVDRPENLRDRDFDVGIDLPVGADDERTVLRTDATRQVPVNPQHPLEARFAGQHRAVADEPGERSFFDVARQRFAFGDGFARRRRVHLILSVQVRGCVRAAARRRSARSVAVRRWWRRLRGVVGGVFRLRLVFRVSSHSKHREILPATV